MHKGQAERILDIIADEMGGMGRYMAKASLPRSIRVGGNARMFRALRYSPKSLWGSGDDGFRPYGIRVGGNARPFSKGLGQASVPAEIPGMGPAGLYLKAGALFALGTLAIIVAEPFITAFKGGK
jgi:hypothetical protein